MGVYEASPDAASHHDLLGIDNVIPNLFLLESESGAGKTLETVTHAGDLDL